METIYLADGLISISFDENENLSELKIDENVLRTRFEFYRNFTKDEVLNYMARLLTKASLELLEDHI